MSELKRGRRKNAATSAAVNVKKLTCELFDLEPDIIYGGWLEDGVLHPDIAPRYEQWFNGYTPASVVAAYYSASLKIYYVVQSGAVVAKGEDDDYFAYLTAPVDAPFFYDEYDGGQYRVVMRNAEKGKYLTPYVASAFTPSASLCMAVRHHHRLFGADADDPFVIRWSGGGNSEDWDGDINGSGYVRLGGSLGEPVGIVSLASKVVVLRERGLTSITALGAPENFKINDISSPSAKIVKGTAAVCGDSVYFYTATGIMRFDGDELTAVDEQFKSRISSPVCAAGLGDRYLLGCGSNIYCYDIGRERGYFIDCPAEVFLNGETLFAFGSGEAHILDCLEPCVRWESGAINFEQSGKKAVTGLYFACNGTAEVTISNGVSERVFTGSGGYYRVGLSGESFTVKLAANADVGEAYLYAEAYDGI